MVKRKYWFRSAFVAFLLGLWTVSPVWSDTIYYIKDGTTGIENTGTSLHISGYSTNGGGTITPADEVRNITSEPTNRIYINNASVTVSGSTQSFDCLGINIIGDAAPAKNTVLTLDNGSTWDTLQSAPNRMVWVGRTGNATLNIQGGSSLKCRNGFLVGYTHDSTSNYYGNGTVNVSGADSKLIVNGYMSLGGLNVGNRGEKGTLTISDGGSVLVNGGHILVGVTRSDGSGVGEITLSGGSLKAEAGIFVGNNDKDGSSLRSTGTFNMSGGILDGTTVYVGDGTVTGSAVGSGTMNLSGGSFTNNSQVNVYEEGTVNISGSGTITGAKINVSSAGTLSVSGGTLKSSRVDLSGTLNARAPLNLNNNSSNEIILHTGAKINVSNGATVSVTGSNAAEFTLSVVGAGSQFRQETDVVVQSIITVNNLQGLFWDNSSSTKRSVLFMNSTEAGAYSGQIRCQNSWAVAVINAGTPVAPVDFSPTFGTDKKETGFHLTTVNIGWEGQSGYLKLTDGTICVGVAKATENWVNGGYLNGGIIIGNLFDANAPGTMVLGTGGEIYHNPFNDSSTAGISIGRGAAEGKLILDSGFYSNNTRFLIGTKGTLEVKSGTYDLSGISENRGVIHLNGGTISSLVNVGSSDGDASKANTLRVTSGSLSQNPNLWGNGTIIIDGVKTVSLGNASNGGSAILSNSGAMLNLGISKMNLISNKGDFRFGNSVNGVRGEVNFVSTQVSDGITYEGYIDGNSWPLGRVNIGTAADPVAFDPTVVETDAKVNGSEYRFNTLYVGEKGATGYLTFTSGSMRTAKFTGTFASTNAGGIILGDNDAASSGTLVLLADGKLLGHQNAGDGTNFSSHNDVKVGCFGGEGRLILASGTLPDTRVHVDVGANGTLEIANGSYDWTGLRLTNYDNSVRPITGDLEITGGTLDLTGNAVTLNALNCSSQYKAAGAKGTVTNSASGKSTVTLDNTASGAYDGGSVTGNVDLKFQAAAGSAGSLTFANGTIDTTGEILVGSETQIAESSIKASATKVLSGASLTLDSDVDFVGDLLVMDGSILEILYDTTKSEPLNVTGDVELSGTTIFNPSSPITLEEGETLKIITATGNLDWTGLLTSQTQPDLRFLVSGSSVYAASGSMVPEPSTWILMILGGLGLAILRKRQS